MHLKYFRERITVKTVTMILNFQSAVLSSRYRKRRLFCAAHTVKTHRI